jgi:hypothetical protein
MGISRYILVLLLAGSYISAQTPFVTETKEDLEVAAANYPERVPRGPEVRTILGNQITPGTVPQDFRINQQIFNDIAELNGNFNNLMQMILNIGIQPTMLLNVQRGMDQLVQMVSNAGIRYNMSSDFETIRKQLLAIMAEIRAAPLNYNFMLFKARLEVLMAEIENAIKTKLVGNPPSIYQ